MVAEIDSLKSRRSNIDEKQVAMRRLVCQALQLTEEEMPFAGELIKVREKESDWEGAIERLLHNFALSLLVPGRHYSGVAEMLAEARWLRRTGIYYWDDIDTHGFAILDQLRSHLPAAYSFLMDRKTLLAHQPQWGREPRPEKRQLVRSLYDDLRLNRLADQLRLEQERIGFGWGKRTLEDLERS